VAAEDTVRGRLLFRRSEATTTCCPRRAGINAEWLPRLAESRLRIRAFRQNGRRARRPGSINPLDARGL
jgi:hypothetical protein